MPDQVGDDQYIKGILDNDFRILEKIYAEFLPAIISFVKSRQGTAEDARDVFQEAVVIVFRKASLPGFQLSSAFGGYLFSICRYIWWRQLNKKHRSEVTLEEDEGYIAEETIETHLVESEKRQLFREKLSFLGAECRQVLQLFFSGRALKEIALQMGYTEDYIKKKNKTCKDKLAMLVKNDRRYHELNQKH